MYCEHEVQKGKTSAIFQKDAGGCSGLDRRRMQAEKELAETNDKKDEDNYDEADNNVLGHKGAEEVAEKTGEEMAVCLQEFQIDYEKAGKASAGQEPTVEIKEGLHCYLLLLSLFFHACAYGVMSSPMIIMILLIYF